MRVAIRADASAVIGHGHVIRCMTLATSLEARGARVDFFCRELPGHLCDLLVSRGFAVTRLPERATDALRHPEAMDDAWEGDAHEVLSSLKGQRRDWLVVDTYAFDARWESAMRSGASRIAVVDDLANRSHDCDLLLDQNLVAGLEHRYDDLAPAGAERLLGPRFALLHPDYARIHEGVRPRSGGVARVLVFFGGADRAQLSARAVDAFVALGRPDIAIDVVLVGATADQGPRIAALRAPNVRVIGPQETLAPLMLAADLAVGAAGATSWERLCVGLPSIVVTLADNQRPLAAELDRRGLARWIGDAGTVSDATIADAIRTVTSRPLDPTWSAACLKEVDGRGTERVVDRLFAA